jgi:hypothetical protein
MTARIRPAQRTLEFLRRHGAMPHVTEKWNPHAGPIRPDGLRIGVRQDMFGLVDVLALWDGRTDFIQACGVDVSSHIRKISESVDLRARLARILADYPRRRFFIMAWRRRQLKGQSRPEWVKRVIEYRPDGECEITIEDYLEGVSTAMIASAIKEKSRCLSS